MLSLDLGLMSGKENTGSADGIPGSTSGKAWEFLGKFKEFNKIKKKNPFPTNNFTNFVTERIKFFFRVSQEICLKNAKSHRSLYGQSIDVVEAVIRRNDGFRRNSSASNYGC